MRLSHDSTSPLEMSIFASSSHIQKWPGIRQSPEFILDLHQDTFHKIGRIHIPLLPVMRHMHDRGIDKYEIWTNIDAPTTCNMYHRSITMCGAM